MGKTFDTKNKILNLLKSGPMTPSELWRELDLAPSTVSQHLKELAQMDKVEEGFDEHLRNIRYYRLRQEQVQPIRTPRANAFIPVAATGFAVVIIGLIVLYVLGHGAAVPASPTTAVQQSLSTNTLQYRNVQVSLTDPPQVPNGTKSVVIQYSDVQVQVENSTYSKWVDLNSSGTVDLLGLVNSSVVMGNLNLSSQYSVNSVRFNITNATITVANFSYPVLLPSGPVQVRVAGEMQDGNSTVMLNLITTITTIYSKGSPRFIMVPSISAIELGGNSAHGRIAGHTGISPFMTPLNYTYRAKLQQAEPNITITNVSIMGSGNYTSVSVAVRDNLNKSSGPRLISVRIP